MSAENIRADRNCVNAALALNTPGSRICLAARARPAASPQILWDTEQELQTSIDEALGKCFLSLQRIRRRLAKLIVLRRRLPSGSRSPLPS